MTGAIAATTRATKVVPLSMTATASQLLRRDSGRPVAGSVSSNVPARGASKIFPISEPFGHMRTTV